MYASKIFHKWEDPKDFCMHSRDRSTLLLEVGFLLRQSILSFICRPPGWGRHTFSFVCGCWISSFVRDKPQAILAFFSQYISSSGKPNPTLHSLFMYVLTFIATNCSDRLLFSILQIAVLFFYFKFHYIKYISNNKNINWKY